MKKAIICIISLFALLIQITACNSEESQTSWSSDQTDTQPKTSIQNSNAKNDLVLKEFKVPKKQLKLIGLRSEPVVIGDQKFSLEFTGKLDYNQDKLSFITSHQNGIVREIYKTIGDHVRKGEPLLQLESIQLGKAQQNYLNSLALLKEAEQNYMRTKRLYDRRIISENEYLKEQSNYHIHQHHLSDAENELRFLGYTDLSQLRSNSGIDPFTTIKAPLSGRIIERYANLGEMINPNKPAYKVANLNELWLFIDIYEKDFRFFYKGLKVYFTPTSYPGEEFEAKVDYLNSQVSGQSRTINIRAKLNNLGQKLLPNMYVKGRAEVDGDNKVLLVPNSAIIDTGKRQFVFVVVGEGQFKPRLVNLGYKMEDKQVVLSGLKEGEQVVVSANFLLDSETQFKKFIQDLKAYDQKKE